MNKKIIKSIYFFETENIDKIFEDESIYPEDVVSAANILINFFKRNDLLDEKEIAVIKKAHKIANQLKPN